MLTGAPSAPSNLPLLPFSEGTEALTPAAQLYLTARALQYKIGSWDDEYIHYETDMIARSLFGTKNDRLNDNLVTMFKDRRLQVDNKLKTKFGDKWPIPVFGERPFHLYAEYTIFNVDAVTPATVLFRIDQLMDKFAEFGDSYSGPIEG